MMSEIAIFRQPSVTKITDSDAHLCESYEPAGEEPHSYVND